MADDLVCEHCCHPPTFKHREAQQQPYRGLWQAFCAWAIDLPHDVPVYSGDIERKLIALWNEQPDAAQMFALRTTRYGREGEAE